MKILLTGGGTGGHFYPLIAVAEEINKIIDDEKIADIQLYYFSDAPYDREALFENRIHYTEIPAGKMRIYFSIKNFTDLFKTAYGVLIGFWNVFKLFPDVIFAKGAYASFPTLFAARILRIPVIIHESDSAPGRVTAWAGKFAKFVALSYSESVEFFPKEKTAHVGQPVRPELEHPIRDGAYEFLHLEPNVPVIMILGGSLGAQIINDAILQALPELVENYQIIHQTGKVNFDDVTSRAGIALDGNDLKSRYKPFAFLNPLAMRMAAGVSNVIITRAGSSLFEIASWGIPAIVIPITNTNNDHQKKNAYNYARAGAGVVIEEKNLTPHIIINEAHRIITDLNLHNKMAKAAHDFYQPNAAKKIARKVVDIALGHVQQENK
jgi:UDP-N-acetylglucosamine--N-acetylmuramyl-(pentapeptide) pyrophosphoryl-undecaprenol N-acetylglucosamine transferase